MKLIFIKKPDCAYVTIDGAYCDYAQRELATMLFDGQPAKNTHRTGWMRIAGVPDKVERIVPARSFVVEFALVDGIVSSDLLPAKVGPDYFDDDKDGDNPNAIYRALYLEVTDTTPEHIDHVECEIAVIGERDADWELLEEWKAVKHRIVDRIETHPALLQDRKCLLSREDSYAIIREHVKNHIDKRCARVTSDYDFCFTVKKIVKTEPTAYERCLNPTAKKLRYVTDYRTHREVVALEIAPKKYEKYPVVEPFRGENQADLKANIDRYLSDLIAEINRPVSDCPHCKGAGVVFGTD